MFNEKDYKEAFSKVRASGETYQEVMNMTSRRKTRNHAGGRRFVVLIAAVVALMAMTVTAFASEKIAGWLAGYFKEKSDNALSAEQSEYIVENEQILSDGKTENGWTVELRSAISDGAKGIIIIGITAPENVNLTERVADGSYLDQFGPGNGIVEYEDVIIPSVQIASPDLNYYYQVTSSWREDGDGLDNTKNYICELEIGKFYPDKPCGLDNPFGADIDFQICIENIVRKYDDEEYRRELMEGKYAGQTDVMFTSEETERLHKVETLVEGTWLFTVNFAQESTGVELLSEPVTVSMDVWKRMGEGIWDYEYEQETVTVTSAVVRPLTVTLSYGECDGAPTFTQSEDLPCVVMRDGSRIALHDQGGSGTGSALLEAEMPIIYAEIDYILFPDGTTIPMPELATE